jgi:hypothetical protein
MNRNQHHEKEDSEALIHRREIRRKLDDKLERKQLKDELEDFDGELENEFDWDSIDLDR